MHKNYALKTPFFEFGPKAYLYGAELLEVVKAIDLLAIKYDIDVIIDPQTIDIRMLVENTQRVHIYAQHMDYIPAGIGMGSILPEALKESGAKGVLLNHAEKKLSIDEVEKTIQRADEVGLATMICVDTIEDMRTIAGFAPNIIAAEPTALIGSGHPSSMEYVKESLAIIKEVNPEVYVLQGAGISNGDDVYNVIKAGAEATGSSSGIAKAANPVAMAEEMIAAVRRAWDELRAH